MSPKSQEQFEEIRRIRRAQILSSALETMARDGYYHASIDKIAKKAGISKGLIYNYFESKEAILRGIVGQGLEETEKMLGEDFNENITRELYILIIKRTLKSIKGRTDYWKLFFSIMLQPGITEILNDMMIPVAERYFRVWTSYYVSKGCKNPEAMAMFAHATFDGLIINYVMNPDLFPLDSMEELLIAKLV